jgi:hypothetical protein
MPEPPASSSSGPPSSTRQMKWPPSGPRTSMVSPARATSWKKGETSPSSSFSMMNSMLSSPGADAME